MPLSRELPAPSGPYRVGAIDIEAPCDGRLIHAATHLSSGEAAFQLDTVLFTLYYPAEPDFAAHKPRHRWLIEPARLRGEGFARFANISNWVIDRVFAFLLWALVGRLEIPADVDVPLRDPRVSAPAEALDKSLESSERLLGNYLRGPSGSALGNGNGNGSGSVIGTINSAQSRSRSTRYPVVVFSHGMAASRTDYTQLCGELASRGYIVAAIEHRDGSGPGSVVRRGGGRHGTVLATDMNQRKGSGLGRARSIRKVMHFATQHLQSEKPLDKVSLQHAQLAFREAEMEETVRVLRMVDSGQGKSVFRHNARGEGVHLAGWKGRLDIERVILAGHSYGATGALRACGNRSGSSPSASPSVSASEQTSPTSPPTQLPTSVPEASFPAPLPIAGCVALDPGKASGPLNDKIAVPLLVIHSHSWSRKISLFMGRPHFDVVRDLVQGCLSRTGAAWFMTSLGTSHPSCTDAPVIQPLLLGWVTGATVEAREGVLQYVRRMQEFIDFVVGGNAGGLLGKGVTHPEYLEEPLVSWKKAGPRDWKKDWQIHVAPEGEGGAMRKGDTMASDSMGSGVMSGGSSGPGESMYIKSVNTDQS